jgi:hypothetical protein
MQGWLPISSGSRSEIDVDGLAVLVAGLIGTVFPEMETEPAWETEPPAKPDVAEACSGCGDRKPGTDDARTGVVFGPGSIGAAFQTAVSLS